MYQTSRGEGQYSMSVKTASRCMAVMSVLYRHGICVHKLLIVVCQDVSQNCCNAKLACDVAFDRRFMCYWAQVLIA